MTRPTSWFQVGTLTLALITQIANSPAEEIIGGDEVDEGDPVIESTVGLKLETPFGTAICTASLIANDIAVTAAHCVTDDFGDPVEPRSLTLHFKRDLDRSGPEREVSSVVVHPNWKARRGVGKNQGDLALVRFRGGLPNGYAPAQLLPKSLKLSKGQSVRLAGFGIEDAITHSGAGTLRKVDVKIASARFATTEILLDQSQGRGACHGDSGGPAFVISHGIQYLWGVTNRGYPQTAPDDCAHQSVYTKIRAYDGFIETAVAELRAS